MPVFQWIPGNHYLIKSLKNTVVFLGLILSYFMFFCSRNARAIAEKPQLKIISFQKGMLGEVLFDVGGGLPS